MMDLDFRLTAMRYLKDKFPSTEEIKILSSLL